MGAPRRTSGSWPLSPSMWEKGEAGIYPSHTEELPRHALVGACASHFSASVRLVSGMYPPLLLLSILSGLQALLIYHRLFREAAP